MAQSGQEPSSTSMAQSPSVVEGRYFGYSISCFLGMDVPELEFKFDRPMITS